MRLTRPALAVTLVLAVAASSPAFAAAAKKPAPPVPVKITDPAGDGNALNDQGLGLPVPSASTPVQVAGADVTAISWTTLAKLTTVRGKKVYVPTGLQVKMTLSAAPQANVIFRVTASAGDCSIFWFNYSKFVDGGTSATLQHDCPGFVKKNAASSSESVPVDSIVTDANSITWTVKSKSIPSSVKVGTKLTEVGGQSRFYAGTSATGGATVPSLDEVNGGDTVYTYGK